MTFAAPDPVASGKEFEVIAVHGRTPHVLDDFVDEAVFTVRWEDQDRLVAGRGNRDGDIVRFTEKDVTHSGKDVRVWNVELADRPGQFTARTTR
jgi:hypothetical protein